jgi:WD40 repeat protein
MSKLCEDDFDEFETPNELDTPQEPFTLLNTIEINRSPKCMAVNTEYLAISCADGAVSIWSETISTHTTPDTEPTIILEEHSKVVSAMAFGNEKLFKLCTASYDKIILWNLEMVLATNSRGTVIGSELGVVEYICFSPNDALLCLCIENFILIYDIDVRYC